MTPQSELEIQGNFLTHPFAELVSEIGRAGLTGSLRGTGEDKKKKLVLYFKSGLVVFAVSNAKSSRLFDIVLSRGWMSKEDILKVPDYTNDFEFSSFLRSHGFLTREASDKLFVEQIEAIITDALSWANGDWVFSSLARVRDGLAFQINVPNILMNYARSLPNETILTRIGSLDESFVRSAVAISGIDLTPEEEFLLSVTSGEPRSAAELMNSSAIPVSVALHAIYTLWVAGLLVRGNYQRAFSEARIAAMHDAKVELKRETFAPAPKTVERSPAVESQTAPEADAEEIMTVEQYLEQVENAETFYDILGVNPKADEAEIKKGYFRLARNFHPDRYHSQGGELLKRIQNAFTEIAQAHETLKHTETREMYDYRVRKELAEREKLSAAGGDGREVVQQERAAENFDTGFTLLMDGETEHAIPFLARAAHYSPKNARYRAYYGKALATDESQRHKAEAEIQAAIKLDPESPTFRLILAEFFVQFNLRKRAEGELKRLLAILPSNEDAKAMLANLKK